MYTIPMPERRFMKDGLDAAAVQRIGAALAEVAPPQFDRRAFEKEAVAALGPLELKARVHHVVAVLGRHLPGDFKKTAAILRRVPEAWDAGKPSDPFRSFAAWPVIDYVGVYGLGHPEIALETLRRLTGMFTAEFAVRPFFVSQFDAAYTAALAWTADESEHVRRLASEGSRPRLPWGLRLNRFVVDPSPLLPLLDRLKDDPSEYVRRSVANNLNDISKDHPELVVAVGKRWLAAPTKHREWIMRHATRSLVKSGHAGTLALLGFGSRPKVRFSGLRISPRRVPWNGTVGVEFVLSSTAKKAQKLVVDFAVHFVKSSGVQKPKVFKGRRLTLKPGETAAVAWRHHFRDITTRAYYPGKHRIDVVVNGAIVGGGDFMLEAKPSTKLPTR